MTAATKTVKVPNYTPEQETQLSAGYVKGDELSVKALAEKMGKSTRSIVAKLSRMGIYQPKVYTAKTGKVEKKDDTADAIGAVLKLSENDTESLTKCNKTALRAIWTALATSKPIEGADEAS